MSESWSAALATKLETHVEYAGFFRRLLAFVIDTFICFLGMAVLALPVTVLLGLPSVSGFPTDARKGFLFMNILLATAVLSKLIAWLYFTIAESSYWQGTPGKLAVGIHVARLEGGRISFWQANKRYWAKLLSSILYLGYLAMLVSEKRQTLHDVIARTVVTRRKPGLPR